MLDPPEIASDLTPVLAILILLVPLETLIPLPAVIVDSANPLDEPINNCPLDMDEVFRPVPPYALLIILPCHVPELIVPTVCRLDAEVRLLSVSIAVSIVVSVTASMLSIPFNEQLPPLSEITLVEPTVKSPPLIVRSPVSEKLFLIVVVPLVAPSVRLVAAPPMFSVVAVPLIKLNVLWLVVMSPPLTATSADAVILFVTDSVPPSVVAPELTFNVPVDSMSMPSPFLNCTSPVASELPDPPVIVMLPVSVSPCLTQ